MDREKQYVAFIDILGFKKYVLDNIDSPENPYKMIEDIQSTAHDFAETIDLDTVAFSDSIVFNSKKIEEKPNVKSYSFLSVINALQLAMLVIPELQCLPLRGGITVGDYYVNDEKNIFYGEAFVRAYELESKIANYPRIVIDPKGFDLNPRKMIEANQLYDKIINSDEKFKKIFSTHSFESEKTLRLYPVAYDFDGVLFCNYLYSQRRIGDRTWAANTNSVLTEHKLFIQRKTKESDNNLKLMQKYSWMKNYHNWFCQPFDEFQEYIIQ